MLVVMGMTRFRLPSALSMPLSACTPQHNFSQEFLLYASSGFVSVGTDPPDGSELTNDY